MSQTIRKIFIEKHLLENDLRNFLEDKEVKYFTVLQEAFDDVKPLLKNSRFVPMEDSYCYDKKINSCWLGLCENNFRYMEAFSSGSRYIDVVEKLREFYRNDDIDIPTKNQLQALTKLSQDEVPFSVCCEIPNNPDHYILARIQDRVQGYNIEYGNFSTRSYGYIHPIYKLYETFKDLSDKAHFLLWITYKLRPKDLISEAYNQLLDLDIEINSSFIVRNFSTIPINSMILIDDFLKVDKIRANIVEYDKKLILDVNKGSWEAFLSTKNSHFEKPVEMMLSKPIVVKNPAESIISGGIVGIDFGTKSTVVVYQNDKEKIMPLRIGIGDWSKKEEPQHYENPTIMEFIDLNSFMERYKEPVFRPKTRWNDLTISHTAYENLQNSHSDNFNAYLTELKQWTKNKNKKLKIEDYKGEIFELREFVNLKEGDINPIEIYAYYLGLYINNQHQDNIYLEYLLSFPVTYDIGIREKVLESFRRGLTKALPDIGDEIDNLRIRAGVSEPAAYAAIALQEYELADENEQNFYGIFDFGGGTTDFDFGVFRWSDEFKREEQRYDYVIEHFGAGGDKYLGGENLLEMMAFEVFKRNKDILREQNISFTKPYECIEFLGSELLLSNSREAKINMVNLIQKLRAFWERDSFDERVFDGEVKVDLYDNNANKIAGVELEVNENRLYMMLEDRISKGIDSFFESLAKAFYTKKIKSGIVVDRINVFLAGNSSKSPIVKELFRDKISKFKEEFAKYEMQAEILVFDPLDNQDDFTKPNGKTGVAFGIIETRPGGNILVIDENLKNNNIKFNYYIGRNRRKRFKVIIDRDSNYNEWFEFIDAGDDFEIYYTSSPLAITNRLRIEDSSVKKIRVPLENKDFNKNIYIRLISPNIFEYGIGYTKDEVEVLETVEL